MPLRYYKTKRNKNNAEECVYLQKKNWMGSYGPLTALNQMLNVILIKLAFINNRILLLLKTVDKEGLFTNVST